MTTPLPDVKYLSLQSDVSHRNDEATITTNYPVGEDRLVSWPLRSLDCRALLQEAMLLTDYILIRLVDPGPFMLAMSRVGMLNIVVADGDYDQQRLGMSVQEVCDMLVRDVGCFDSVTFIISCMDQQYATNEELLEQGIGKAEDDARMIRPKRHCSKDGVVTIRYRDKNGDVTIGTF